MSVHLHSRYQVIINYASSMRNNSLLSQEIDILILAGAQIFKQIQFENDSSIGSTSEVMPNQEVIKKGD